MQCKFSRNDGLFAAGLRAQEILSPSDAERFLKALVDYHPRCRTSEDFKRLALELLNRWKTAVHAFAEFEYLLDFGQELQCREEYFYNVTSRPPILTAAELRQWTKRFVEDWIREKSSNPATIAQNFLTRDKWDSRSPLTKETVLAILDSSGLTEPWAYPTHEQNGVTYADLNRLKHDAILKAPTSLMDVVKRFVPWHFKKDAKTNKLYRYTADGKRVGCHLLLVPFLYDQSLPAGNLRTEALSGDWLDWRRENLIISSIDGKQAQLNTDIGESKNSYEFNESTLNLTADIGTRKKTSEPSRAKKENFDRLMEYKFQHVSDDELQDDIALAAAKAIQGNHD
jgi:hypothetical protein